MTNVLTHCNKSRLYLCWGGYRDKKKLRSTLCRISGDGNGCAKNAIKRRALAVVTLQNNATVPQQTKKQPNTAHTKMCLMAGAGVCISIRNHRWVCALATEIGL